MTTREVDGRILAHRDSIAESQPAATFSSIPRSSSLSVYLPFKEFSRCHFMPLSPGCPVIIWTWSYIDMGRNFAMYRLWTLDIPEWIPCSFSFAFSYLPLSASARFDSCGCFFLFDLLKIVRRRGRSSVAPLYEYPSYGSKLSLAILDDSLHDLWNYWTTVQVDNWQLWDMDFLVCLRIRSGNDVAVRGLGTIWLWSTLRRSWMSRCHCCLLIGKSWKTVYGKWVRLDNGPLRIEWGLGGVEVKIPVIR